MDIRMRNGAPRWAMVLLVLSAPNAHAETPITGLQPASRPAGAPVITQFSKDHTWYAHALSGVSQPYPASLRFLEDQGAWFTPFTSPGMRGPYDLRGWHSTTTAHGEP